MLPLINTSIYQILNISCPKLRNRWWYSGTSIHITLYGVANISPLKEESLKTSSLKMTCVCTMMVHIPFSTPETVHILQSIYHLQVPHFLIVFRGKYMMIVAEVTTSQLFYEQLKTIMIQNGSDGNLNKQTGQLLKLFALLIWIKIILILMIQFPISLLLF